MQARQATPAPKPETGATVADARRLAPKILQVAIFYRSGPRDYDQHCLFLDPAAFLRAIASKPADQAMPCRVSDNNILMIGVEP